VPFVNSPRNLVWADRRPYHDFSRKRAFGKRQALLLYFYRISSVQQLTNEGLQKISDLAQRYGVSTDAVTSLLQSVVNGNGTMAQFFHSELGGGGQWMRGGMTMVGDMFNHGLKSKVDGLCNELSQLLTQQPFEQPRQDSQQQWQSGQQAGYNGNQGSPVSLFVAGQQGQGFGSWWPSEFGSPNSSGGQNNVRYAYFANARRLAIEINGKVTVYDTLNHQIGGVSQQQSFDGSMTFTSQFGTVNVSSLPIVSGQGQSQQPAPQSQPVAQNQPAAQFTPSSYNSNTRPQSNDQEADIFAKLERLADLHQKGIVSSEEFAAKKSELLSRL
jgi:hypothetical protein